MIRLENIHLVFPEFALSDINLDIHKHDFFSLIGPTGSGKSLLLEGIMGLVPFTGGRVYLNGEDITDKAVEKRNLAIVYQNFALFPHLDVAENIMYGIRYHHINSRTAGKRLDRLVATLGLERITRRRPDKLSGGEKQRVALARSLILNPGVLLLDEPLSALDPIFHEEAKKLLKKIHQELDITIVMVSHNFPDVLFLANRGAIIKDGKIMQSGKIESIFEKPNSRFTADFVGMKNIHPVKHINGSLKIEKSACRIIPGQVLEPNCSYMGIRPEDIALNNGNSNHFKNRYEGQILEVTNHGVYLIVRLETPEVEFEAIWPRSYIRDHGLKPGKTVSFGFHPEAVHTF